MSSLNTSTNGPSIKSSYTGVINSPPGAGSSTYAYWALYSVSAPLVNAFQQDSGGKESVLKVQSTGDGELTDLIDEFSEGRVQFAFVKVKDPNTTLPKYVLIGWCGEGVPERTKGYFNSHLSAVSKILHGYHVQITARSDRDLTPEGIVDKVSKASGANYSAGSAAPPTISRPPPPPATKPVFNPSRSGGNTGFNPLASRVRPGQNENVDADGWGTDAPPVVRSQLEKVESAYKPTKVNMAELMKQKPDRSDDAPNVVKGAYQPVGKVDIAAIRAQAQYKEDDRPTIVKGAYEPVGKVDIAAIRARAQKPSDETAPQVSSSNGGADEEPPKSLAERSAAFNNSERLTSLPKPKVANKFGSNSTFTGTKAPTPGQFGLQSAPANVAPPPVGAVTRTFANEGGKTPAQIWAEKKARERGTSGAAENPPSVTSPIPSQKSGGGEWKSGYTGKTWAPVAINSTGRSGGSIGQQRTGEEEEDHPQEEAPTSPGIGALRDRFKGGAPMGAPSIPRAAAEEEESAPPPPIPAASRPGGVPMPGLPARPPAQEEEEEEEETSIPPPPPVREPSPARIAMPVSRTKAAEIETPEEHISAPPLPTFAIQPEAHEEEEEPASHAPAPTASAGHGSSGTGKRAVVLYDYEKAEDNELELTDGDYVTNIEMVDEDWWMGTNSKGESGLFPSNYVELVQEEEAEAAPAPPPAPRPAATPAAPAAPAGPTANAIYDYEAAEDNELSFPEGAKITGLEFPDEDWWFGHYNGKSGLFPANYVELEE